MIGHGLFNSKGPSFFGSSSVWFSGFDNGASAAALRQAVTLSLTATAAFGAVSDRITIRAGLLLSFIITGIVVPVTARTVWNAKGEICPMLYGSLHSTFCAFLWQCWCRDLHSSRQSLGIHCHGCGRDRRRGRRHHTLHGWHSSAGTVSTGRSQHSEIIYAS